VEKRKIKFYNMRKPILDKSGKVVGWTMTQEGSGTTTYLDGSGKVEGRVVNGRTLDENGSFVGKGDQALRLFGENNDK